MSKPRLTVGELKKLLENCPDNLRVATYVEVGEDMDEAHGVKIEKRGESGQLYCKGDHVLEYVDDDEVLVIH